MTYPKILAFVVVALCATSAQAETTMQSLMQFAANGHDRSSRANGFNPRQNEQNADNGYEQRQQREVEPSRQRNEGFGYGFERRQERSGRPDYGRRGRD